MNPQLFWEGEGDRQGRFSEWSNTLTEADAHSFYAAEAYLQAGDPIGSSGELNSISPANQIQPGFLTLRWRAFAKAEEWRGAYEVAEVFSQVVPHMPEPWLLLAEAAWHIADMGPMKAIGILAEILPNFHHEPVIPFTLACYNCGLGRLEEAHGWWMAALCIAKRQGTDKEWKRKALEEPGLQPLWSADSLVA